MELIFVNKKTKIKLESYIKRRKIKMQYFIQ